MPAAANEKGSARSRRLLRSGDQDDGIKVELAYDVSPPHSVPSADPKLESKPSNSTMSAAVRG